MATTNPNAVIGQNLKRLREQMAITQDTLAQFLETSREQIAYYESGSRTLPSSQLSKLANLFCLDEYDFYEEDSENQRVNLAFAFRADCINPKDLDSIAQFKRIVRNYLNMKKVISNG